MNKTVLEPIRVAKPILIYSLFADGLRLQTPLSVSLDYDGEQFIAYSHDLDLFGYGETEGEALDDLRKTIVDLYFTLKGSQNKLEIHARKIWKYLTTVIQETGQLENKRNSQGI